MVDARDSKSRGGNPVSVRFRPPAPGIEKGLADTQANPFLWSTTLSGISNRSDSRRRSTRQSAVSEAVSLFVFSFHPNSMVNTSDFSIKPEMALSLRKGYTPSTTQHLTFRSYRNLLRRLFKKKSTCCRPFLRKT